LAKTKAIKTLSDLIEGDFQRIQFTPDLLPSDITGTEIYRSQTSTFEFQKGPIFHNLVLADEINRAPAKVQAALLEAMAEKQVSVGSKTYPLDELFLVMATQNPIEQEGTYPLPEAQLDRFLLHCNVDYPSAEHEKQILRLVRGEQTADIAKPSIMLTKADIFTARKEIAELHMSEAVEDYIVHLTMATRTPGKYNPDLEHWIEFGVSPRATIALDQVARAHAWLNNQDFVAPDNVMSVLHDVFRHRLLLTYGAQSEHIVTDMVIDKILDSVPVA
jgi:MoxR-like ATPase